MIKSYITSRFEPLGGSGPGLDEYNDIMEKRFDDEMMEAIKNAIFFDDGISDSHIIEEYEHQQYNRTLYI